jgi:hypothetical protein
MKIIIEKTPDEILELTDRSERRLLYKELEDEFKEDIEDLVYRANRYEKERIFDSLIDDGYGDDLFHDMTIEDKRYMMNKADDDMLMYLIDKYKYF